MPGEATILEQLPNGGAVVAIIVVVWFFLSEIKESRKEYREHLTEIMKMGLEAHKETRDAIRSLSGPPKAPKKDSQ
jgi:signal transduction histidine kinase